jgi:hypothetical protein
LDLQGENPVSKFAFKFNLYCYIKAAAEGTDVTAGQADPVELYQFSGRFGGGVANDITGRYLPHFVSDWTDGFSMKTVSASLMMYFGGAVYKLKSSVDP